MQPLTHASAVPGFWSRELAFPLFRRLRPTRWVGALDGTHGCSVVDRLR